MTLLRTPSSTESAYAPLLQDEAGSQDDVTLAEHDTQPKAGHYEERGGLLRWRLSPLVYCACALSLLCSAFNLSILALNLFSAHIRPSPPLEYASSYMGLEATVRDPSAPPFGPITNFPTGIGQVNESEPHAVYFDVHRWSSTFGMVYPEDRRILSSSTESTYIQFWAGDFGMERCSLKFTSPAEGGVRLLSAPETTVRVWRVDVPRHGLDFHLLSWNTRPPRGPLFASLILRHNSTAESEEFHCPSGSFQTFELSCAGADCRVDFRQSPKKKDLGFWLVQRPSI